MFAQGFTVEGHTAMEFSEVLERRRSVRHFKSKEPVGDHLVRTVLRAGTAAPSAGNIQPWRFIVVRSAEVRTSLAEALGAKWAATAPVMIVVCADPRPCYARYGDRGDGLYAIQDAAAATQNMLLAAVDLGLASCWIGAFDADTVKQVCGIQPAFVPLAILPLGYSAESAGRPSRRPLEDVVTWL